MNVTVLSITTILISFFVVFGIFLWIWKENKKETSYLGKKILFQERFSSVCRWKSIIFSKYLRGCARIILTSDEIAINWPIFKDNILLKDIDSIKTQKFILFDSIIIDYKNKLQKSKRVRIFSRKHEQLYWLLKKN